MRFPIENFEWNKSLSQFFGMNADYYRKHFPGMWAHNGLDIDGEYGQPIIATHDGYVQSMSVDDPNHTKGNEIYKIKRQQLLYGLLAPFEVQRLISRYAGKGRAGNRFYGKYGIREPFGITESTSIMEALTMLVTAGTVYLLPNRAPING